jgi:hypothetical protein
LHPFFSKCKRRVVSQRRLREARAFSTCSADAEKIRHKKGGVLLRDAAFFEAEGVAR